MKYLFILLFLFSGFTWAKDVGPYQILPLDSGTENALKASSLSSEVVEHQASQKDFHKKAISAFKKVDSKLTLKNHDPLYFVYDCLFMVEEGFYLKYSNLSKAQITAARKTIIESFEE